MDNYFIIMTVDRDEIPETEILAKVNNEKDAQEYINDYVEKIIDDYGYDKDEVEFDEFSNILSIDDGFEKYIFTIQKFN